MAGTAPGANQPLRINAAAPNPSGRDQGSRLDTGRPEMRSTAGCVRSMTSASSGLLFVTVSQYIQQCSQASPPPLTATAGETMAHAKAVATQGFAQGSKLPQIHFLEPVLSVSSELNQTFSPRPRSDSHHLAAVKPPSRKWLYVQARTWRFLMRIGMRFHDINQPKPPMPAFVHTIPTSPHGSTPILLYIYTPPDYQRRIAAGHKYPVVVNFHGGGFVLGTALDDRFWTASLLQNLNCVVVSVGYRLAPEHPFPTAVDDSVDALLYLSTNAETLGLDITRIALSGFSAGANLAFAVPMRLKYHTRKIVGMPKDEEDMARWPTTSDLLSTYKDIEIVSIVAWYPLLDWTESRASKKRHSVKPEKVLSKFFTDLFDHSYLPCPDIKGNHASPYASPALAPEEMLKHSIPHDVQMFLCEYDMLLHEGQLFNERLEGLNKNVETKMIPGMPHGFDKSPSPFRDTKAINALYAQACAGLLESFGQDSLPVHQAYSLAQPSMSHSGTSLSAMQRPKRHSIAPNMPL
jgi:putative ergosteryl-3beta-O-L-aspartate hydrolase